MRGKTEILRDHNDGAIGTVTGNVRRFKGTHENLPGWNAEGSPGSDNWNLKRGIPDPERRGQLLISY